MSLFLILACLVALAALAILLAPLWRSPRAGQESASVNEEAHKLRDELRELGKLHAEGALDHKQYTRRKAGLERKLVDIMVDAPAQSSAPARPSRSLGLALSAFIVIVAAGGYAWVGTPQALTAAGRTTDAASTEHALNNEQIEQMLDKLVARLKEEPDNAEGWIVLARSYAVMGRHAEALPAFRRAAELRKDDPVLLADYADTLAVTQGRKLDGEPMRLIEQALKLDPDNVKALSLAGTFAFSQKDYAGAIRQWERVLQVAPADSPLAMQIRSGVDEARQLAQGKVPAAAAPGPAAPAPAPAPAPAATAGATAITGTVSLAPSLAAKASPEDIVFVFARPAEGPRMPLAIVRKQVKDLPFRFELDDSMAMTPQSRLSAFPQVVVGARISKSGRAVPEPGDLEGLSQPVAVGTRNIAIEIRDVVASR